MGSRRQMYDAERRAASCLLRLWHVSWVSRVTQIRAASLSGDCTYKQEFLRGNWRIQGQHQACVRRRAELSVSMNPACSGAKARRAVEKVYDTCFKDTAPFDRRP